MHLELVDMKSRDGPVKVLNRVKDPLNAEVIDTEHYLGLFLSTIGL